MIDNKITKTWVIYEEIFIVQTPTNTQSDRVYADVRFKRDVTPAQLLKGRDVLWQLFKHGMDTLNICLTNIIGLLQ